MFWEIQTPNSPLLIKCNESEKYKREIDYEVEKEKYGFRIENLEIATINIPAENYNQLDCVMHHKYKKGILMNEVLKLEISQSLRERLVVLKDLEAKYIQHK